MSAFLDAVNMASIAIILAVVIDLGQETILDWRSLIIAVTSFLIAIFFKNINTAFIILGGAILGYLLTFI